MICPQCGYDMGNKNKCLRCGYEVKTLTVVEQKKDEQEDGQKEEREDVKVIDPCNVFLTHPYGYEDDFGTGFGSAFDDPFVSLIDSLFGDPIGDLLGGLFGFETVHTAPPRNDPSPKRKKQGPIVVVDDIEIIEPDKEGQKEQKKQDASKSERNTGGHKTTGKIKNMFKRNNNKK